jgi:hypothetical protein
MDPERKKTSSAVQQRVLLKGGPRVLALGLVLLTLTSQAKAQEPLTFVGFVTIVAQAFEKAKDAYDAYKSVNSLLNPDPSTAELINRAVLNLSNVIVGLDIADVKTDGQEAMAKFDTAVANPTAENLKAFDDAARNFLDRVENKISTPNRYVDAVYFNALGGIWATVLPLYLQGHLMGEKWGIPRTTLQGEVMSRARQSLQFSYDMVGAKKVTSLGTPLFGTLQVRDTTVDSLLYAYVKMHSQSNCFNSAAICAAYFQTNATVQAVQTAANGLVGILQAAGASYPGKVNDIHGTAVIVDPAKSWTNNWQGYANAAWTAMQEETDGMFTTDRRCPSGWGIVGVWQVPPPYTLMGFLCQKWSLLPPWSDKASVEVPSVVEPHNNSSLVSLNTQCPDPDFVAAGSAGWALCVRRLDYGTVLPHRGACGQKDVDARRPKMPPTGSFTALPEGNYLTGFDPTSWHYAGLASFFYCSIVVPLSPILAPAMLF